MPVKRRLTPLALRQLAQVLGFIAERNPGGARNVQARLAEIMDMLLDHPSSGMGTARAGQRRRVASPYPFAVTCRIGVDGIVVLGIRQTARRPART